jgi:hypothetical protein
MDLSSAIISFTVVVILFRVYPDEIKTWHSTGTDHEGMAQAWKRCLSVVQKLTLNLIYWVLKLQKEMRVARRDGYAWKRSRAEIIQVIKDFLFLEERILLSIYGQYLGRGHQ